MNRSAETPPHQKIHTATRYVLWAQLGSQVVSLVVLAGLYRLIDPVQFGLLGMIMPVVLLLRSFGTLGFNVAAVQHRDLTDSQATTLFWWQVASGGVLVLLLLALTPLLAALYDAPELLPVGWAISGTALLSNLYTQHQAMAERKLRLGWISIVRLVSLSFAGIVALVLAWFDFGIWALVVHQYLELLLLIGGIWWIEPWRPSRPSRGANVRELLKFGGMYTLSGVFFALSQNLDKLLLAFFLGGTTAGQQWIGYYTQAFNQMTRPVFLITTPVTSAMLPALASVKGDRVALLATAIDFYRLVAVVLAPSGIGIFLVGDQLMPLLGGPAWQEAGALLAILGLSVVTLGLISIGGSLLAAVGRADLLAIGAFVLLLLMGQAMGLVTFISLGEAELAPSLGLGLAWAYALVTLLFAPPYLHFCFRAAGLSSGRLFQALRPSFQAAAIMGVFVFLIRQATLAVPPWLTLPGLILAGVLIYTVVARGEVRWLLSRLKRLKT